MKNIHAILLKAGMDFVNVVKSTLFIEGISNYGSHHVSSNTIGQ
jgi:enamine deaminase RidA (YjgF/YER057c/UK114 family)